MSVDNADNICMTDFPGDGRETLRRQSAKGGAWMGIHGGDIYRNHVDMDFSVNVNPLGTPKSVIEALGEQLLCDRRY